MNYKQEPQSFLKSIQTAYFQIKDLTDSLFKNELSLKSIPFLRFLFYVVFPNFHYIKNFPRTDFFFFFRRILMETRILILNFENMPWLDGFVPLINKLTNIKKKIRDCEIISLNIDKLLNYHRKSRLETIRIIISILFAVIRLICLDPSKMFNRNRKYKESIYNEREVFEENNCPNCGFQNNLY